MQFVTYFYETTKFVGTHDYSSIAAKLTAIHSKYGLDESNICVTVTDNGSNFKKCFQVYGSILTCSEIDEIKDEARDEDDEEDDVTFAVKRC